MNKNYREEGFTLLEIILALSILATLGIMIIHLLSDQIKTREKISYLNTDEHALNSALNRLVKDLQGAVLSDQTNIASLNLFNRSVVPQFYVQKENLIFFTMAFKSYLNGSNQSNQAFVRYYTKTISKEQKQFIRVIDTNLTDSIEQDDVGFSQVLLDDIESFSVKYWDGNSFLDTWSSKENNTRNKLPKLVKIHLASFTSEGKNQLQLDKNIKKQVRALDTVVYLNNTKGQKEVNTPSWVEYKWQ